MNKYDVFWTKSARDDLEGIINYIAQNSSLDVALLILERVEKRVQDLKELPFRGRIVGELEEYGIMLYREIVENPWRIFYRIREKNVYILAIIDGRRNIEDILFRKLMLE
ncbi:MAG: type II toxin-antitoxin system RelE/ParE family toxin [Elusimicrobiota bacterium]